jgi:hypothetical protein
MPQGYTESAQAISGSRYRVGPRSVVPLYSDVVEA